MTAIELLIVIAIVGVLAGIILPRFGANTVDDVRSAARIIVSDFGYARNLAVSNNTSYEITFDSANGEYSLQHTGTNTAHDLLPSSAFANYNARATVQTQKVADLASPSANVRIVAVFEQESGSLTAVTNLGFGPLGNTLRTDETIVWLAAGSGDNTKYLAIHVAPITGLTGLSAVSSNPPL